MREPTDAIINKPLNHEPLLKLARRNVQQLTPYLSARRIGGGTGTDQDIWLNANESGNGSPLAIHGDGVHLSLEHLNRYGECQPPELIQAYSDYTAISPEHLLVCRGADEAIDLLIRAFCEPQQDQILYCPPTYGMYKISAEIANVAQKTVPLTDRFELDLPAITAQLTGVKLLFICSPNNPTGNLVPLETIETLLELTRNKALVVIDEAYIDFDLTASAQALFSRYDNLVILRTLSKAFSLAGLRCGFAIAHPQVIALLLKIIAPYPISNAVEAIATQTLNHREAVMRHIKEVIETRHETMAQLSKISSIEVLPSEANYLLFTTPHAQPLFEALWKQGIILRQTAVHTANGSGIRMSIGTKRECLKTVEAIRSWIVNLSHTDNRTDKR